MEWLKNYELLQADSTAIKSFIHAIQNPTQFENNPKVLFILGPVTSGKSTLTKLIHHECKIKTYTLNSYAMRKSYIDFLLPELNDYGLVIVPDYRGEYNQSNDFEEKNDTSLNFLVQYCIKKNIPLCVNSLLTPNIPKESWCVHLPALPKVDTDFYYKVLHRNES